MKKAIQHWLGRHGAVALASAAALPASVFAALPTPTPPSTAPASGNWLGLISGYIKDGGIVTAYDSKTGEQVYQERVAAPGQYYASPVAANGRIYFTSLADGTITVIKAGADKPEVVATNPKLGERTAATPAIADDTLFVRTALHLFAFAEAK